LPFFFENKGFNASGSKYKRKRGNISINSGVLKGDIEPNP